jgi:hypothetical protein
MNTDNAINPRELCSRKLYQLVTEPGDKVSKAELEEVVAELAERRRYLAELRKLGKLNGSH